MLRSSSVICGLTLALLGSGTELERVGRLEDPAIVEASGIVRSRKHPGIYWVHNDSGNPAILFAVRRDGALVRSYQVDAVNVDWEDIATDDAGHLYVGDIGNNKLKLPIRAIHTIDEPDPEKKEDGPLKVASTTFFRYPEGDRFDAEGLFVQDGQAFVVSKHLDGREAGLYRIKLDPPAPLLRPTTPQRVATLEGCREPATGADLSADGKRLAIVTDSTTRIYEAGADATSWKPVASVEFHARNVEAVCWDGPDLILASEDRSIYRVAESTWKQATPRTGKGRER